ncbi:MAG: DUF202 domain-containing protein [Ornithinimicrobium sp.]|uniref:DUF202 domain-containing protein n=1 Tax=Ornithinimicrobium sp. TaxID=1977084 RepID=UPI003D9BF83F
MPPARIPGQPQHGTAAHLDSGLQPERTTLSWSRTCMACVVVSAVFLRWLPFYGLAMLALPMLTMAAALGISVSQRHRTLRGVQGIHAERLAVDPTPMLMLALLTLVLGACGLAFVAIAD